MPRMCLMPDNKPLPHDPPTVVDRLLNHPELAAAVFAAVAGVGLIFDSGWEHHALVRVPWMLGVPVGAVLFVAGVLASVGIIYPRFHHLEQHGWHLLVSAAFILAVVLTYTHAYRLVIWLVLMWAAIGLVRAVALHRIREADRRIYAATRTDEL